MIKKRTIKIHPCKKSRQDKKLKKLIWAADLLWEKSSKIARAGNLTGVPPLKLHQVIAQLEPILNAGHKDALSKMSVYTIIGIINDVLRNTEWSKYARAPKRRKSPFKYSIDFPNQRDFKIDDKTNRLFLVGVGWVPYEPDGTKVVLSSGVGVIPSRAATSLTIKVVEDLWSATVVKHQDEGK